MDSEQRGKLAEKLDNDLDVFIASLEKTRNSAGTIEDKKSFNFEEWEKEIQGHPAFMSSLGNEGEMSEAMEALGIINYVTFIGQVRCPDPGINAVLLANRAAAEIRMGNFRSAIRDCAFSLKCSPKNEKVLVRGAECLLKLGYPEQASKWLGDLSEEDRRSEKYANLMAEVEKQKDTERANRIKEAVREKKDEREKRELLKALKRRGILKFGGEILPFDDLGSLDWSCLEVSFPGVENCRVNLDDSGDILLWPVVFCYPEFDQMDFVKEFAENSTFFEQLSEILEETPEWDMENQYKIDRDHS